jgi:two-component system CheB/CheR fusion protein
VVIHLSPEHESHLADLLRPHVKMEIRQVTESVRLEADRVYVIPPNADLEAIDTHLRLAAPEPRRGGRTPVDHFFRTLAFSHREHAIGVVLTGSGSDGALGLKAIKEHGGLTVAQDPDEAEYDGMPQSAVATGQVDLVLPLAEIPQALVRYATTEPRIPLPESDDGLAERERRLLHNVFAQMRVRTGRDFSRYKRTTILRRIARRMQLHQVEELPEYLDLLRDRPEEVGALADELLINVTSFFRDPEAFEKLEKEIVPGLFANATPKGGVRVWSVGCATGEEAYSLAILLLEEAARRRTSPPLQVFASDLHEASLQKARAGFYAGGIEAEVGAERLARYFERKDGGYRVRGEVRDIVVFAAHNVLGDPPFSRIDLIACRNLLIYLQRDIQREVVEIFHYALKPDGVLMLGSSETLADGDLFRTVDKPLCIHQKRNVQGPEPRLPVFPLTWPTHAETEAPEPLREPAAYGRLHQRMVERYAPPSVLVSQEDKVVHLSEHAGRYFVPPGGAPTTSAFKLIREELRLELRAGLQAVRERGRPHRSRRIALPIDGEARIVVLDLRPALEPREQGFVLLIFDERAPTTEEGGPTDGPEEGERERVEELEAELELTSQRLEAIIEEYETGQEHMKASNEELQSSNEELRSTLEELETGKEELQSMNEELRTVNQENRHKVEELAQLSGDLQNLLASTEIATLFLDRELRIMRFTAKVGDLFSIRAADRGRQITDLTHRLGYPDLLDDAREVLRTLVALEREVQDEEGSWYLTRVLPYRSTEDRIEGVVLTFVDITVRKRAEEELLHLTETLEARVASRSLEARELAARITTAEQEERRRISHVLHDEVQQLVHGVRMKLSMIRRDLGSADRTEILEAVDEASEWLDRVLEITNQLTIQLSPPVLREQGLAVALEWLRRQMAEMHDLEVAVEVERDGADLDEGGRLILFLAVRELLFNVKKHAGVARATVRMDEEDGHLVIRVSDRGAGFDLGEVEARPGPAGGFGLSSIRERLRLLGGRLEIHSRPGTGTRVDVHAPVATEAPTLEESA